MNPKVFISLEREQKKKVIELEKHKAKLEYELLTSECPYAQRKAYEGINQLKQLQNKVINNKELLHA